MTVFFADEAVSSGGSGTQASPWPVTSAITGQSGAIHPGDTLRVKGTSSSTRNITMSGSSSLPIWVYPWMGSNWIVDTAFLNQGLQNIQLSGNAVYLSSNPNPWRDGMIISRSHPTGTQRQTNGPTGLHLAGGQNRGYGVFIHNCDGATSGLSDGVGSQFIRCMSWNTGLDIYITPGTAGPSNEGNGNYPYYMQNNDVGIDEILEQCVAFYYQGRVFYHLYGSSAQIANEKVRSCCFFGKGARAQIGASVNPAKNFEWSKNWSEGLCGWGYFGSQSDTNNGSFTDNFFHLRDFPSTGTAWTFRENWDALTVSNNIVYLDSDHDYENTSAAESNERFIEKTTDGVFTNYSFSLNQYYGGTTGTTFMYDGVGRNFAQWQAKYGEAGSTWSETGTPPDAFEVLEHAQFPDWAIVRIRNFTAQANTVSGDVSAFLNPGDSYVIRSAEDPLGTPLASGTYSGGNLSFTMNNSALEIPLAYGAGQTGSAARPVTKLPKTIQIFHLTRETAGPGGGTVRTDRFSF